MKPIVNLYEIDLPNDFISSVNFSGINSDGRDKAKYFKSLNVGNTFDNDRPWVTITCTPYGIQVSKNFL